MIVAISLIIGGVAVGFLTFPVRILVIDFLCERYGHRPIPHLIDAGEYGVVSCLKCDRCKICLPAPKKGGADAGRTSTP